MTTITVPLSEERLGHLRELARQAGLPPEEFAGRRLEDWLEQARKEVEPECQQVARERFERHFGAVDLGRPTGVENEGIDADLAREYGDSHGGD